MILENHHVPYTGLFGIVQCVSELVQNPSGLIFVYEILTIPNFTRDLEYRDGRLPVALGETSPQALPDAVASTACSICRQKCTTN